MDHASRLGELLVRERRITREQLQEAQQEQRRSGQNLTAALLKLGYIDEREITVYANPPGLFRLPSIDLDLVELDPSLRAFATRGDMERLRFLPLAVAGNSLIVAFPRAVEDALNALCAVIEREVLGGRNVEPVLSDDDAFDRALARLFAEG